MVTTIGVSTAAATARRRSDVSGNLPASFRYNNPGAQYPSQRAALFGQIGFGIIGGGHKIARFPSPVNGAAANFDLLYRNYTGMQIGAAGQKWTGANGFGVPGYDSNATLTKEMLEDPASAIALLKAIAHRESGSGNNLTDEQWRQAHRMFLAGSADAYLKGLPRDDQMRAAAGSRTGESLYQLARNHVGEEYENILVPKNDANWKGPWDCAELVSWAVYQTVGELYGCEDNNADPARAEAYTGAWQRDAERLGKKVSVEEAASTMGGVLLRYPPGQGGMGHIAICDGRGNTIEAKGRRYGVVEGKVSGRHWDTGILVPGLSYETGPITDVRPPAAIYRLNAPNMDPSVVINIQTVLIAKGYNPGSINGHFGLSTQAAVINFQKAEGLVVDGEVGPETAEALGISLVREAITMGEHDGIDQEKRRKGEVLGGVLAREVMAGKHVQPDREVRDMAASTSSGPLVLLLALMLLARERSAAGPTNSDQTPNLFQTALQLILQSALTGKQVSPSEFTDLVGAAPDSVGRSTGAMPTGDTLAALLVPLLFERLGGKPVADKPQDQPAEQPKPGEPVLAKPSVQLGIAGVGLSSILQALGFIGTPFGVSEFSTTAGTLATLIPLLTGVFGAANGFGALQGIGRALLGVTRTSQPTS